MDFTRFEYLTFDCYGTLIDWEAGIGAALRPVLRGHGHDVSEEVALELFGSIESGIQTGEFLSYAEVLRRVMDGIGSRLGFEPDTDERNALVASIGEWPVFPDTRRSLAALAGRYRLVVLSNVDDELFDRTSPALGVSLHDVITAQQVRSYKPSPAHWHAFLARADTTVDRVLHVAQSLFHDIAPARRLGIATVWVNRRSGRPGSGATPHSDARPDLEVPDLASLLRAMELAAG